VAELQATDDEGSGGGKAVCKVSSAIPHLDSFFRR
jgi:hypothetical protein